MTAVEGGSTNSYFAVVGIRHLDDIRGGVPKFVVQNAVKPVGAKGYFSGWVSFVGNHPDWEASQSASGSSKSEQTGGEKAGGFKLGDPRCADVKANRVICSGFHEDRPLVDFLSRGVSFMQFVQMNKSLRDNWVSMTPDTIAPARTIYVTLENYDPPETD